MNNADDGTVPGFDPAWAPRTPDTTPPHADHGRASDDGLDAVDGRGRWRLSRRVMLVLTVLAVTAGGMGVGLAGLQHKASVDHGLLVQACERDAQAMDAARTDLWRTVTRLDENLDAATLTQADATLAKRWRTLKIIPQPPAVDCGTGRDTAGLRDASAKARATTAGYRSRRREAGRIARKAAAVLDEYRREEAVARLRRHLDEASEVSATARTGGLHDPYTLTRLDDTMDAAARLLDSPHPDPDEAGTVDGTLTGLTGQVESDPGYPREDMAH